MALEATHIKFALDLRDKYKPSDLGQYICGTVYPDSRYLTGIDRHLTHEESLVDKRNADDFSKGWAVHFLCDKIDNMLIGENFPELLSNKNKEEWWVNLSAIKNVQDICLVKNFDVRGYLKYLDNLYNPNGEDLGKIRGYNQLIQNFYRNKEIDAEDCRKMWLGLGVESRLVDLVHIATCELLNREGVNIVMENLYKEMLARASEDF